MQPVAAAPSLDAARFARAFPFHLWLDESLRIRGIGASLHKAMPALRRGMALDGAFQVRRPRDAETLDDWRRHGGDLCTLKARTDGPPLTLRGNAEVLDDDSLLLLVTPVLGTTEELRALGLGFNDLARHDATGEMLMLARTTQISAADTERMAQRLKMRSELLDSILELSHNGVLAFGPAGQLQHTNAALLRMLGLQRGQLAGLDLPGVQALLDERTEPAQRGRCLHIPAEAAAEEAARFKLHLVAPRPAVIELSSRRGADGSTLFYLRDMTAESEIDRMKSEFLSTAAHELRTPMVSIFGFTELLLHRPVGEAARRDVLETVHRQASLLINMVNELLDLARIEARQGKDLQREPLGLGALVSETAQRLNLAGGRERIRIALDHGGLEVLVDRGKTSQALTNVLSNAVKYSPGGGEILVQTRLGQVGGVAAAGVQVSDSGIGMTPEQLARVFERFFRADPSGNIPGTGLGMSLVKEIVELQGGRIDIASQPGAGTSVTLWLPLCEQPAQQTQVLAPAPALAGV